MKLEEKLAEIPTVKNENNECKLLKRLLAVKKLDKAPVGYLMKSVTIYLEGKIHIKWNFSYFCDIMKKRVAEQMMSMKWKHQTVFGHIIVPMKVWKN